MTFKRRDLTKVQPVYSFSSNTSSRWNWKNYSDVLKYLQDDTVNLAAVTRRWRDVLWAWWLRTFMRSPNEREPANSTESPPDLVSVRCSNHKVTVLLEKKKKKKWLHMRREITVSGFWDLRKHLLLTPRDPWTELVHHLQDVPELLFVLWGARRLLPGATSEETRYHLNVESWGVYLYLKSVSDWTDLLRLIGKLTPHLKITASRVWSNTWTDE